MIRLKSLLFEWTGSTWTSCKQWESHRSEFLTGAAGATININKSSSMFELRYEGPATGISIAHAKGSAGDTLHQLFNVLICEINPWLFDTMYKPVINDIQTSCVKQDKTYIFTISVPIVESEQSRQLNHRGGWGHDPGANAVKSASPANAAEPVKNVVKVPGSSVITTYFTTYTVE